MTLMGIIIVLILSASMSTLAAFVLVSSSSISIDFVKGLLWDRAMMTLRRVLCLYFGVAFEVYFLDHMYLVSGEK